MSLLGRSGILVPPSGPQPEIIVGVKSTLVSDTDTQGRMVSFGQQEHFWQTPDGLLHFMSNTGTLNGAGQSLLLSSSSDNVAYTSSLSIPNSDDFSTGDGWLVYPNIWFCYNTSGVGTGGPSAVINKVLHYNGAGAWSVTATETVFNDPNFAAQNPAQVVDSAGGVWCFIPATNLTTRQSSIFLYHRASGGVWSDTGFTFGPTAFWPGYPEIKRSARPVNIPGPGVAVMYTVPDTLTTGCQFWWAVHNGLNPANPWTQGKIYTDPNPNPNPYASHYFIKTDANFNQHMVVASGGVLLLFRKLAADTHWTEQTLSKPIQATYPGLTITSDGKMFMVVNNQYAYVGVLETTDLDSPLPVTVTHPYSLRHPPPGPNDETWPNPRVRIPGSTNGARQIPLLMQMTDPPLQRAMSWLFDP